MRSGLDLSMKRIGADGALPNGIRVLSRDGILLESLALHHYKVPLVSQLDAI